MSDRSRDHKYYRAAGKSLEVILANRDENKRIHDEAAAILREETEFGDEHEPMFYKTHGAFAGYRFDARPDSARWKIVSRDQGVYYPKTIKENKAFLARLYGLASKSHLVEGLGLPGGLDLMTGDFSAWTPAARLANDKVTWLIVCPLAAHPTHAQTYKHAPEDAIEISLDEYIELTTNQAEVTA